MERPPVVFLLACKALCVALDNRPRQHAGSSSSSTDSDSDDSDSDGSDSDDTNKPPPLPRALPAAIAGLSVDTATHGAAPPAADFNPVEWRRGSPIDCCDCCADTILLGVGSRATAAPSVAATSPSTPRRSRWFRYPLNTPGAPRLAPAVPPHPARPPFPNEGQGLGRLYGSSGRYQIPATRAMPVRRTTLPTLSRRRTFSARNKQTHGARPWLGCGQLGPCVGT